MKIPQWNIKRIEKALRKNGNTQRNWLHRSIIANCTDKQVNLIVKLSVRICFLQVQF